MPIRKPSSRRTASVPAIVPGMTREEYLSARGVSSLAEINSDPERLPSSILDLTPAERRILKDPDWVDAEESDIILAKRIERKEGGRGIPLRELVRRRKRDEPSPLHSQ